MSEQNIITRLQTLISQELDANIPIADIDADTPLFEGGLGLDSVILVELIAQVEKQFEIKFNDDELNPQAFSTVRALATMILSKIAST
jgi:acyl carrier protein